MASNIPIYNLAKELDVNSHRIILACKSLGIQAKGSTKRLNQEELEKVKIYFSTGKNVSEEIIEINKTDSKTKSKTSSIKVETPIKYFPNRLIAKS